MAFWFLGRYGLEEDYSFVLSKMPFEENPFVQSETALATLRLMPFDD